MQNLKQNRYSHNIIFFLSTLFDYSCHCDDSLYTLGFCLLSWVHFCPAETQLGKFKEELDKERKK